VSSRRVEGYTLIGAIVLHAGALLVARTFPEVNLLAREHTRELDLVDVATREDEDGRPALEGEPAVLGVRGESPGRVEPGPGRGNGERHVVHEPVPDTPRRVSAPKSRHVAEHVGGAGHAVVVGHEQHRTGRHLGFELGLTTEIVVVEDVHQRDHVADERFVPSVEIVRVHPAGGDPREGGGRSNELVARWARGARDGRQPGLASIPRPRTCRAPGVRGTLMGS